MEDKRFSRCQMGDCDMLLGHGGEHALAGAICWHFKYGQTGQCFRHEFDCMLGGCGDNCSCIDDAWQPDEDE